MFLKLFLENLEFQLICHLFIQQQLGPDDFSELSSESNIEEDSGNPHRHSSESALEFDKTNSVISEVLSSRVSESVDRQTPLSQRTTENSSGSDEVVALVIPDILQQEDERCQGSSVNLQPIPVYLPVLDPEMPELPQAESESFFLHDVMPGSVTPHRGSPDSMDQFYTPGNFGTSYHQCEVSDNDMEGEESDVEATISITEQNHGQHLTISSQSEESSGLRRSTRSRRPPVRYGLDEEVHEAAGVSQPPSTTSAVSIASRLSPSVAPRSRGGSRTSRRGLRSLTHRIATFVKSKWSKDPEETDYTEVLFTRRLWKQIPSPLYCYEDEREFNGSSCLLRVTTEAAVSVISKRFFDLIMQKDCKEDDTWLLLNRWHEKDFGQRITQSVMVTISWPENITDRFLVVKDLDVDVIIGDDLIKKYNLCAV
jgi:hypothetical protein